MIAPFDLPTQILKFRCQAERPLYFCQGREGATLGTTLAGAFGEALCQVGCARQRNGAPRCLDLDHQNFVCPEEEACHFSWLYKPYSKIHRRPLGRPIGLRAPELEGDQPVTQFSLQVILWGRHTLAGRAVILDALHAMGSNGFKIEGRSIRFRLLSSAQEESVLTLQNRIQHLTNPTRHHALLTLATPLLIPSRTTDEDGSHIRTHPKAGAFNVATLLGNCAYELTAWDLEDRQEKSAFDHTTRHHLCRQARQNAEITCVKSVKMTQNHLSLVDLGHRTSRSNGRPFPLQGLIGHLELTGDINAILPWLVVLDLCGGGQRRSMGFGAIRLWFM
ncbi:MAG: hypothetical protein H7832_09210 [Magnetococcus sp. DMHC-6]